MSAAPLLFITGASSGIGQALAARFQRGGYRLALVVREAVASDEAIEFRGEFLHAFLSTERVRSHLPVTVKRGATEVRADGMEYDNLARVVELKGRMVAVFAPPRAAAK